MSDAINKAVFLSYASQDAEAARRICESLRQVSVEVWFDQSELRGGDAWDAKIRKQIKECALFVPIISANTQARPKGYFRREWKVAVDCMQDHADGIAYLVPIAIDGVSEREAMVPESFLRVQWMRLIGPSDLPTFAQRVAQLLSGSRANVPAQKSTWSMGAASVESTPPKRWSRRIAVLGLAAVLGFGAVLTWKWTSSKQPAVPPVRVSTKDASPAAVADENISVAVLPFANVGGNPEHEYFSDGLTEEIISLLMRERGLQVVGRTSSFAFKGKSTRVREIAQELGVTRIVEGSVRRVGDAVRITVSVTRAADDFAEQLGSFEKDVSDPSVIFALQDDVARAVVQKLTRRSSTVATATVLTRNAEAYDLYLRGREAQASGVSNNPQAEQFFEQAVALDPTFALAWARLADARVRPVHAGNDSPTRAAKVRAAIAKALELQPNQPEALIARANLARGIDHDFAAAKRDLELVQSLQPPTPELRFAQSVLATDVGDWDTALRRARETFALDPQNYSLVNSRGLVLASRGLFAEAERFFWPGTSNRISNRYHWRGPREALKLWSSESALPTSSPSLPWVRASMLDRLGEVTEARSLLQVLLTTTLPSDLRLLEIPAIIFERSGDTASARRAWQDLSDRAKAAIASGDSWLAPAGVLARAEAGLGNRDAAVALLTKIREKRSPSKYWLAPYRLGPIAEVYGMLGMVDEVIALWQRSMDEGFQPGYRLRYEPEYAAARKDPRFQALMKRAEAWADAQPKVTGP